MNRGFSLVEVLTALMVTMAVFVTAAKLTILSVRSNAYSESLTYASVLGHTRLVSLKSLAADSPDLKAQRHEDAANPSTLGNRQFYCFWQVDKVSLGKRIVLHVAWDDGERPGARSLGSLESLEQSGCPYITFTTVISD